MWPGLHFVRRLLGSPQPPPGKASLAIPSPAPPQGAPHIRAAPAAPSRDPPSSGLQQGRRRGSCLGFRSGPRGRGLPSARPQCTQGRRGSCPRPFPQLRGRLRSPVLPVPQRPGAQGPYAPSGPRPRRHVGPAPPPPCRKWQPVLPAAIVLRASIPVRRWAGEWARAGQRLPESTVGGWRAACGWRPGPRAWRGGAGGGPRAPRSPGPPSSSCSRPSYCGRPRQVSRGVAPGGRLCHVTAEGRACGACARRAAQRPRHVRGRVRVRDRAGLRLRALRALWAGPAWLGSPDAPGVAVRGPAAPPVGGSRDHRGTRGSREHGAQTLAILVQILSPMLMSRHEVSMTCCHLTRKLLAAFFCVQDSGFF